jgi:hypothetical protein
MKWLKTYPKSASYVCQRIFAAFGKVNNQVVLSSWAPTPGDPYLLKNASGLLSW